MYFASAGITAVLNSLTDEKQKEILIYYRKLIELYLSKQDYISCFKCYEILFETCSDIGLYIYRDVYKLLTAWIQHFRLTLITVNKNFTNKEQEVNAIVSAHVTAAKFCDKSHWFICSCANFLYSLNHDLVAREYYEVALKAHPNLLTRENFDNLNCKLIDRWHFSMLNDHVRNSQYGHAIYKSTSTLLSSLQPFQDNLVILDVGGGTGILSMYAALALKSHTDLLKHDFNIQILCYEKNNCMHAIASEVLNLNKFANIDLICDSTNNIKSLTDPKASRIDLIITETFDSGLLGEGVITSLHHLLHLSQCSPNVIVVPQAATLHLCLVESLDIRNESRYTSSLTKFDNYIFSNVGHNHHHHHHLHDLSPHHHQPYTSLHLRELTNSYKILSNFEYMHHFNFNSKQELSTYMSGISKKLQIHVTSLGYLDAVIAWFDLQLDHEYHLSSTPSLHPINHDTSCWQQAIYPVCLFGEDTYHVDVGDVVLIEVSINNEMVRAHCTQIIRKSMVVSYDPNTKIDVNHAVDDPMESDSQPTTLTASAPQPLTIDINTTTTTTTSTKPTFYLSPCDLSLLNDTMYNQRCLVTIEKIIQRLETNIYNNSNKNINFDTKSCNNIKQVYMQDITTKTSEMALTTKVNTDLNLNSGNTKDDSNNKPLGMVIISSSYLDSSVLHIIDRFCHQVRFKIVHSIDDDVDGDSSEDDDHTNINHFTDFIRQIYDDKKLDSKKMVSFVRLHAYEKEDEGSDDAATNDGCSSQSAHQQSRRGGSNDGTNWFAGYVNLIENNGRIKSDILKNISICRKLYLSPNHVIIPNQVHCMGMLISSTQLMNQWMMDGDDQKDIFKISQIINKYKASYHVNINMSTLDKIPMTEPFYMFTFNFDKPELSENIDDVDDDDDDNDDDDDDASALSCDLRKPITNKGAIHALIYWFVLKLHEDDQEHDALVTLDTRCHWKQAAVLVDPSIQVDANDFVNMKVKCSRSSGGCGYFSVEVNKVA